MIELLVSTGWYALVFVIGVLVGGITIAGVIHNNPNLINKFLQKAAEEAAKAEAARKDIVAKSEAERAKAVAELEKIMNAIKGIK
jgi:beta-lactam-binding protein with PASTA domain